MGRNTFSNPHGGKTLDQLSREDMLFIYAEKGTFDACAVHVGCNRNSWRKYWYELNLPNPATIPKLPKKAPVSDSEVYEILACSDLHLGSINQQLTSFLDFVKVGIDDNIQTLIIPGDLSEGLMKRPDAPKERFLHSIDEIYDYTNEVFSLFADYYTKIIVINGNHDDSLNCRQDGFDICRNLSKDFKSIKYEYDPEKIVQPHQIDGDIKAILYHGASGCQKNLVSRTRKITIDFMNVDDTWSIGFFGHCHQTSNDFWIQKHTFSLGAFQSTTSYLANKAMSPNIQGQKIQYQIDKKGKICNLINIPYNYNDSVIKNDFEIPNRLE